MVKKTIILLVVLYFLQPEPEPGGEKIRRRSRSRLKKKSGAGAAKKFAGSPVLRHLYYVCIMRIPQFIYNMEIHSHHLHVFCGYIVAIYI